MDLLEKAWHKGKNFLKVEYPVIAGGMTWISDFTLVKAVSEHGAFPVLAAGNMPPDLFAAEVDRCIKDLKKPFAVNLVTIAPNFKKHYAILQEKKVEYVVFAGNFPRKADVQAMKASGKKVMAFASTRSIAEQMIRFGVDALILEGSEAGGHIGHVSLIILLQQVLFGLSRVPVFVAGGIADGRMIAHLLLMGAAGVQLGTKFVMTEECSAHKNFKQAFKKARARQAVATPQYDSRLPVVAVRAVKNTGMENFGKLQLDLLRKMERNEVSREKAQFEVENYWMGSLKKAVVDGDVEQGSLMAGQSVGLVQEVKPMGRMLKELVTDAAAELRQVKDNFC